MARDNDAASVIPPLDLARALVTVNMLVLHEQGFPLCHLWLHNSLFRGRQPRRDIAMRCSLLRGSKLSVMGSNRK